MMNPRNNPDLVPGYIFNGTMSIPTRDEASNELVIVISDRTCRLHDGLDMKAALTELERLGQFQWCNNCKHMSRGGMMNEDGCTLCYCGHNLENAPDMGNVSQLYYHCKHWTIAGDNS